MITNRPNTSGVLAVLLAGASALDASASGFRLGRSGRLCDRAWRRPLSPPRIMRRPFTTTRPASLSSKASISAAASTGSTMTPPSPPRLQGTPTRFTSTSSGAAAPQFFSAYTPKDWPLSFGLGVYSPYGGNMSWPQDTGFRSGRHGRIAEVCDDQSGGGAEVGARSLNCRRGDGELCGPGNEQGLLASESP